MISIYWKRVFQIGNQETLPATSLLFSWKKEWAVIPRSQPKIKVQEERGHKHRVEPADGTISSFTLVVRNHSGFRLHW